ncbi:GntR family transcriptional regulator / MocR family aminotransferase [Pseudobutyrivibrio sp. YE44]|uniref:aminotransferase-like domain-containing protein n=1 Tax=Pseudobutyrivibrio sp. YE44 TaxID=1520802 RepID=UPI000888FA54|nr:PLP-dependent aminotransferase family protein [Pseudobutyrivibrio sp. YE44]SDB05396.1 GntR family transcriptional regulator / MocR family aminotransferase [Pseudobutyrivibrio sp. YE44]
MKVYETVYNYYLDLMKSGDLKAGDRMPSLRECERTLSVSRTSVENAYLQLAADGYIYSVEKVGYFVTDLATKIDTQEKGTILKEKPKDYKYDLATIGEDKQVSCLNMWRRYMKSALRQEDRLLSYGDYQGERDLRIEIANYVRKRRNIICSEDDIVIGAGFQNLLQILIALIPGEKSISFPTRDFFDGATTFKNAGFQVSYRNKESHVIYVTPSYMTKWGEVMTIKRRHELCEHAIKNNHLIIEDDYQNEFVFSSKPTPSLYALNGGVNTAFLGSFSRVLLPSVRISFIILPKGVKQEYNSIKKAYNQTASKAEQIALAQFLRDGHLNRHIKKMRRLYEEKRMVMEASILKNLSDKGEILKGESGMELGIRINKKSVFEKIIKKPVSVGILDNTKDNSTLLLSCSKIDVDDIDKAVSLLLE